MEQAREFFPGTIISTKALDLFNYSSGVTQVGGPDS